MSKSLNSSIHTSRGYRLISSTLILLGLAGFLLLTWKDYSEFQQIESFFTNENGFKEDKLLKGLPADEMEFNSLKVQEQISTIRDGLATSTVAYSTNKLNSHSMVTGTSKQDKEEKFDAAYNLKQILNTSPVVIFIKSSHKLSTDIKNMLVREYDIFPDLAIVDLDKHTNGNTLLKYIESDSEVQHKLPYVFVNGVSMTEDIEKLHKSDSLLEKLRTLSNGKIFINRREAPSNS